MPRIRKPKVRMPEVSTAMQIKELKRRMKIAQGNWRRQQLRVQDLLPVRVRPEFWEQVIRDYKQQIERLSGRV